MAMPNLGFKYTVASGEPEIEVTKPAGASFYFPLLANVNAELRPIIAKAFINELIRFVHWLDEPDADWARLINSLSPLAGFPTYAQTQQEKEPALATA